MAKFTGDWAKAKVWANRIRAGVFTQDMADDLQQVGDAIARKIEGHIEAQDLDWAELAESTVARKGHARIYEETRAFKGSIKASVERSRFVAKLTIIAEGQHPSGMTMQELAQMLEYGTSKMDARPLWRPVFAAIPSDPAFRNLLKFAPGLRFG